MGLFNIFKRRRKQVDVMGQLHYLTGVLDPLGFEIMVVRKRCEVLFINEQAKIRIRNEDGINNKCKGGFSAAFPALCAHCPYGAARSGPVDDVFEIEDINGYIFQVRCTAIDWTDGDPAFLLTFRDISAEIDVKKQLYKLAYIDVLTGIPNRTRLKEDFTALEGRIISGELAGILAIIDLDHFKRVNENYGHNTGDIVLRRLVEHLQGEPDFIDRLYRIGGDEFVLLHTHPADRFESIEDLIQSYNEMLSSILLYYSLPNIDLTCSLSMGVSIFPRDGNSISEILRKADIALENSKNNGRNKITFFTGYFDTMQKFKDIFINIQAVMTEKGKTFGYELIDCGGDEADRKDDEAVDLKDFNRTLDALGIHNLNEKHYYFISFTHRLFSPTVLSHLPRDQFIVHLNQPLRKDIDLYHKLIGHGYKLAITNMNSRDLETDILELADYCMFTPKDGNVARQREIIWAYPGKRFVATGVDTQAEFNAAKNAGFHLFKGYYFRQPDVEKKAKEINPLKANYLRLMHLSNVQGYMDFREISALISSDVALSYKLLRILNSAAVGLRNVTSIHNAVAYLGEDNLKKWIAVLALRGAAEDKPIELIRLSLVRAHFGELLASHFRIRRSPQKLFMIGILSLLHIALDTTREDMLSRIPVEEDIRESLLTKTGVYSDMLGFYENYENAYWERVAAFVEHHQLDVSYVNEAYIESVKWYSDLIKQKNIRSA